jgi:hypothetical protein
VRKLQPELKKYVDENLKQNPLAKEHIAKKDYRGLLVEVAKCFIGIREKSNKNDGPIVELIQKTCGGKRGHAWCMYFVQTCIAYVEETCNVKSKISSGGSCASIRTKSTKDMKVNGVPLPGAIILWIHANGNGHTGIVSSSDGKIFYGIEGNTTGGLDEQGNVEREGGGCYYTKRSHNPTGEMKLWGFLKPCFEVDL